VADYVQDQIDRLADALQRSVVLDDPAVRLVCASRHFGDEDKVRVRAVLQREADARAVGHVLAHGVTSWKSAGVIPPNPDIGMRSRVCTPVRWRDELLGLLMVMDAEGTLTEAELRQVNETAAALAVFLATDTPAQEVSDDELITRDLLAVDSAVRRGALAALPAGTDDRFAHVTALALTVSNADRARRPHREAALRAALSRFAGVEPYPIRIAVEDDTAWVLLGTSEPMPSTASRRRAERLAGIVDDLAAGRFSCTIGAGRAVVGLELAHQSAEQARVAADAAGRVFADRILLWDDLGVYAPLMQIPSDLLSTAILPAEILRVQEIDKDGHLLRTIAAFLDHAGSGPDAARALHVHRTTLYYRLQRVKEQTGLDLADGRTRLALHVGLAVLRLIDSGFDSRCKNTS